MHTSSDANRGWERQHEPRFAALRELIGQPATVLDVGAAPYTLSRRLLAEGIPVTGIVQGRAGDPEEQLVFPEGTMAVRPCTVDREPWPYADGSVDCVVMGAILEHLFDPLFALREARRVAGDDGVLVLSTPNATRLLQRVRMLAGRNPFDGFAADPYHRHQHEWTAAELDDILEVAGWAVEQLRTPALARPGLAGRLYARLSGLRPGLADQLVVRCRPAAPVARVPLTYRESVVDRGTVR